jgi:HD superfamily phosphodiesterase
MRVVAGVHVPETPAADEASRLVQERTGPLIFHHSVRVFLFGGARARETGASIDLELLYLASVFHDAALLTPFLDAKQRFEIDGADLARAFMAERGFSREAQQVVWTAVALHTTPGVPARMAPEVAATAFGVEVDAVGAGLEQLDPRTVEEIVAAHPRDDFKRGFVQAFVDGLRGRPDTAYGTVYADIPERFLPDYRRPGMADRIAGSGWPT